MPTTNGPQRGKSLSSGELEGVTRVLKICKNFSPGPSGRGLLLQSPCAAGGRRNGIDLVCRAMLWLDRLGRGAEARSSRAEVPRSFGGLSERCSEIFRRSRRRQSRRGGWGARSIPAHCHPRNRVERYEERDVQCLSASCFFPCAPFLPEDYKRS